MQEIRAVWIPNRPHSQVLTSLDNINEALDFLKEKGFNTIFPVVWNQGFTLFKSQVMVKYGFPEIDPFFAAKNFDPLVAIIQAAKARNLVIIPWFEYGFAASPIPDGGHILQQKPYWSGLDKNGDKVRHGGLTWMNSLHPEVQQFLKDLILEVATMDGVAGIQGDDRLPALPFNGGYEPETKQNYKDETGKTAPNNEKEKNWVQWRANKLTEFLADLNKEIKEINSQLIVSMSPAVFPFSLNNLMQDSKAWIKQGLVDFLHPQIYRSSFANYEKEVKQIVNDQDFTPEEKSKFVPGIAFRANQTDLTVDDIVKCVKLNRKSGFQGQVFFHYEGLKANNNAMAIALQQQAGYDTFANFRGNHGGIAPT